MTRFMLCTLCLGAGALCHAADPDNQPTPKAKAAMALALASSPSPEKVGTPKPGIKKCECVLDEPCLCKKGDCNCEPSHTVGVVTEVKDVPVKKTGPVVGGPGHYYPRVHHLGHWWQWNGTGWDYSGADVSTARVMTTNNCSGGSCGQSASYGMTGWSSGFSGATRCGPGGCR
jgi:hypothetical protein